MTQAITKNSCNPFLSNDDRQELMKNLNDIDSKDLRTKFKNTQDPIVLAFDAFNKAPLDMLAKDFIKESFNDVITFITEICK